MFKKVLVHTRRSIKVGILVAIALFIVAAIIASFYKISYSVSIDGQFVGYTDNKSKLQAKINDYIEGNGENNTAFVQVDNLPEYKICLVKREVQANDDVIFESIQSEGTNYYRYYAILDNQDEKVYVSTFAEAEEIVNKLKEKASSNIGTITIAEKYETQIEEIADVDTAVSDLYVEAKPVTVAKTSTGIANVSTTISSNKVNLGISLTKPVSGVISSRFGVRSSIRSSAHTGLDIATSKGTPILAAAGGTVTFSGWKGSYGYLVIITHSNGVQTYYGHCSALYVTAGQTVAQGQKIAAVGSTGNSTGPHLHFEVRVDGVAYNPQNYLY